MNRYINKYNHGNEKKLREMHSKKKEYWQFLNSIKGKPNTKRPSVEVFYEYFEKKKNQNDSSYSQDGPDDLDFQDEEDLLN